MLEDVSEFVVGVFVPKPFQCGRVTAPLYVVGSP